MSLSYIYHISPWWDYCHFLVVLVDHASSSWTLKTPSNRSQYIVLSAKICEAAENRTKRATTFFRDSPHTPTWLRNKAHQPSASSTTTIYISVVVVVLARFVYACHQDFGRHKKYSSSSKVVQVIERKVEGSQGIKIGLLKSRPLKRKLAGIQR